VRARSSGTAKSTSLPCAKAHRFLSSPDYKCEYQRFETTGKRHRNGEERKAKKRCDDEWLTTDAIGIRPAGM